MKLDVEGFETSVLRGAAATLRAARPHVLFEAGYRTACAVFVDLLDTLGSYRYVMATGSYRPLVDLDRARLPDAKVEVLAVSMARIESLPDAIRDHLSAGGLHGT